MAFPSISNLTGANPGPNAATLPDTVQLPVGNLQKVGRFGLSAITPSALSAGPSINVQTFASTGIGLLVGDIVMVDYNGSQTAAVGMLDARVSALDTLEIKFLCTAGTPTPAAASVANPYFVTVLRVQPLWTPPASGNQITF